MRFWGTTENDEGSGQEIAERHRTIWCKSESGPPNRAALAWRLSSLP
jgi:hypothetical protein